VLNGCDSLVLGVFFGPCEHPFFELEISSCFYWDADISYGLFSCGLILDYDPRGSVSCGNVASSDAIDLEFVETWRGRNQNDDEEIVDDGGACGIGSSTRGSIDRCGCECAAVGD
jgi:hypothetical protein